MGQTLSEPVTEKETTLGEDSRMLYGASSMQGWRISNIWIYKKEIIGKILIQIIEIKKNILNKIYF